MVKRKQDEKVQVGRLAIRTEGAMINAYYAEPDTMADAVPLASMRATAARLPGAKEAFLSLGQVIVGELIFEKTGQRVTWGGQTPAPEHEREGHE